MERMETWMMMAHVLWSDLVRVEQAHDSMHGDDGWMSINPCGPGKDKLMSNMMMMTVGGR